MTLTPMVNSKTAKYMRHKSHWNDSAIKIKNKYIGKMTDNHLMKYNILNEDFFDDEEINNDI